MGRGSRTMSQGRTREEASKRSTPSMLGSDKFMEAVGDECDRGQICSREMREGMGQDLC
jgi:hypothetical protein